MCVLVLLKTLGGSLFSDVSVVFIISHFTSKFYDPLSLFLLLKTGTNFIEF